MNPYVKETMSYYFLGEKSFENDVWFDTGLWVEVGGLGLVICSISASLRFNCNNGFRIVDENDQPLLPYRTKNNTRHSAHFSWEAYLYARENLSTMTFHMIANCQYAKLQVRPSHGHTHNNGTFLPGRFEMGLNGPSPDAIWNHKPISTMTAIPLVPYYQPGANTIFTYPQSRMPRTLRMPDKPPVIHKDKLSKPLKKDSA